jgi:hypothetical protein
MHTKLWPEIAKGRVLLEDLRIYIFKMPPLLASSNEFAETPMEAPLDGCIIRAACRPYRGYARSVL